VENACPPGQECSTKQMFGGADVCVSVGDVMAERRKIALRAIKAPGVGSVLSAPPILEASGHTVDYTCGRCGTILMRAELDQVHNLLIHCTRCGTYNSTDVEG